MAITARDMLKHLAESVSEGEAEVYLAAPDLLAVCRALLALVDGAPRQYQFDTELQAVSERAREVVDGLPESLTDDGVPMLPCPWCGVNDLDQLVWDEDGEYVCCGSCGFCWEPGRILVHRPK